MKRLLATVAGAALVVFGVVPASAEAAPAGRQADFVAAARDAGVPESVLLGVSYLESRWDTNRWAPSTSGGYGPMHLTDSSVTVASV